MLVYKIRIVFRSTATFSLFFFICMQLEPATEIPAFPEAQGFGANTIGGRGGKVYVVSTLASDGDGSLREALEGKEPRTVVFNVSGVIDLGNKDIVIEHPYLTVAGQTAPSDGIVIKNAGIEIASHDIIIRGMRVRIGGSQDGSNPRYRDGLRISNVACEPNPDECTKPHNIILDHNSISWSVDENASIWSGARDITLSWNIISEGLACSIHKDGCHSMGLLVGAGTHNLSLHHNFIAHHADRSPEVYNGNTGELINNVIYDWGWAGTILGGCGRDRPSSPSKLSLVGNYYRAGPTTYSFANDGRTVNNSVFIDACWSDASLFLNDNLGPKLGVANLVYDWDLVNNGAGKSAVANEPALALSGVVASPVMEALESVLAGAGAISPERDSVDTRVIEQFKSRSGGLIDSESEVEAWAEYLEVAESYLDTDVDGMPDLYELYVGLDPNDPDDASLTTAGDGYTNIEGYTHFRMNNRVPLANEEGQSDQKSNSGGGVFGWFCSILSAFFIFCRSNSISMNTSFLTTVLINRLKL